MAATRANLATHPVAPEVRTRRRTEAAERRGIPKVLSCNACDGRRTQVRTTRRTTRFALDRRTAERRAGCARRADRGRGTARLRHGVCFAELPWPSGRPFIVRPDRTARRRLRRSWTGSGRVQHAGATAPAGGGLGLPTSPATRYACRARRPDGSCPRPWSTIVSRTAAMRSCSGARRTGRGCARPAMAPRPRARAAGAEERPCA